MSSFNLSLIKCAFNYVSTKLSNVQDNKQVLEPFSTILKLAIISFKDYGTKIAVNNNKLYIQEPSIYQGPLRRAFGNSREELHHLFKPIMRCIELYPIYRDNKEDDNLSLIYKLAINGIKKLKSSYNNESSTVCYSLDLYISILEKALQNEKLHIDSYDTYKNVDVLNLSTNTIINIEKIFKDIWDSNDIILISNLFKSAVKLQEKQPYNFSYLTGIENIIIAKESIITEKINKASLLI